MSTTTLSSLPAADARDDHARLDPERPSAPMVTAAAPARRSFQKPALFAGVALLLLGGGVYFVAHRGIETTDDAQVDGDVINVPARLSAVVKAVHFADNQPVHKGDLLAELDDQPAKARLAQAEAELVSAQASAHAAALESQLSAVSARTQRSAAQATLRGARVGVSATVHQIAEADAQVNASSVTLNKADIDLRRAKQLVADGAMAQAQLDTAQAAFDGATAQLAQARARAANLRASSEQVEARVSEANARFTQASTVDQQIADADARAQVAAARVATAQAARDLAALDVSYTKIYAPEDGIVSKRAINVGQMIGSGSSIVSLVPTQHLWLTGNFKETQLEHMKVGQKATAKIDAYGVEVSGTVESIQAATGSRFTLLPPDNATGNFTKVVQRVPVRIALRDLPAGVVLRPGLSIDLSVDTRN
jgi:membrane fusion protein (multidrug efflux system)